MNGKVIAGGDIFGLKWGTAQSPQMKTICAVAYGRLVWQLEGITRGFRLRTITRTNSLTTSRWFFVLESNSRLTTAAQTDDLRWNDEAELSKWKRRSSSVLEEERILEHMKTPITRRIGIRKYENADTDKNEKIFWFHLKLCWSWFQFEHLKRNPSIPKYNIIWILKK